MSRRLLMVTGTLLLAAALVWAATPNSDVSAELRRLYEEDQAERREGRLSQERDLQRLERARELLLADQLVSGDDYYHAAILFQHSADRSGRDHLRAHVLATVAAVNGHEKARWLSAAALDRFLEWNGHEQFFGTQFQRDDSGPWRPGVRDSHATEAVRELFRMPDDAAMQERADSFNE